MNRLLGTIIRYALMLLSVLVIGWTMMHTYDVLYSTNPIPENQMLALYGLIVFELGAIIWFGTFLKNSQGLGQHAVSLVGAVVGVALVLAAFALDYLVPHGELVAYNSMARWAIILATCVNVVMIFLYHLFNPVVWDDLTENIHVADLHAKANKKAEQMIDRDSDEIAEEIARVRKERVFARARMEGKSKVAPNFAPMRSMPPPMPPEHELLPVETRRNGHSDPNS
jgi:hypothetical protein